MRRVIIPLKQFNQALVALDPRVPLALVSEVACRIAAQPEYAPLIHGGEIRVLQTRSYGDCPAFSLFYKFDEKRVYLTHIELRDELEVFDEVELWGEARV
jgi:hypothetical protein